MEESLKTERLQRLEFVVHGVMGKGGLVQDVVDIRTEMKSLRDDIKKITELQTKQVAIYMAIGFIVAPFLEAYFMKMMHAS